MVARRCLQFPPNVRAPPALDPRPEGQGRRMRAVRKLINVDSGGFVRTTVFLDIGSKIGFRNWIQNWIRPFRLWDANPDAKLDTQWGILGLRIVWCTTGHPAGTDRHLFKNYY